jgi:O-antigen/teichoic acid export membrane protein
LQRTAWKLGIMAGVGAAVYSICAVAAGPGLVRLVYGGDHYIGYLKLLPYLGVALVLRAVGDTGFGVASRAAGRPDLGFWAALSAASVTLTLGLVLVARYGALGAAAGWMASSAAACLASVCLFRSQIK